MTRVPTLAVVALLVGALVVPAAGAGLAVDPQPVLQGTPRVLPAGESPASGVGTPQPGVGAALAADTAALDSEFLTYVADERLADADGTAERNQVAREEIERVDDRFDSLRAAERRAHRGHANGTLSERELLARLARVQAATVPLNATLDNVRSATRGDRSESLAGRQATVAAEYRTLIGPVRARTLAAFRGTGQPTRVFVQSSDVGLALGYLDGTTYYREAFRADNRDADVSTEFGDLLELVSALNVLYPWVSKNALGFEGSLGIGGTHLITRPHSQGQLSIAIDGSTGDVFREVHRLDIEQMPTRTPVNATNGSVRVSVARTYPGGPMQVRVAAGGTPASSVPVLVNGEPVGQTDGDGTLWTLTPSGEFNVTADAASPATVRVGG